MKVAVMLAQEPVVAEDFSAAKRLQIYDVPDEGGESTLVCDVARDCLDDEALALRIVEEDCEAVLCGSRSRPSSFLPIRAASPAILPPGCARRRRSPKWRHTSWI